MKKGKNPFHCDRDCDVAHHSPVAAAKHRAAIRRTRPPTGPIRPYGLKGGGPVRRRASGGR